MQRRKKRQRKKYYIFIGIIFLVVIALGYFYNLSKTRYWDGKHGLNVAIGGKEDVYLISIDPEGNEVSKIIIPGNTEVELSRDLGEMKIKNVWQLGFNEGLKGNLLSETITKNFKIASYTWTDDEHFLLFGKHLTNLSFGDRFRIMLFLKGIKNYKGNEIDLAKTSYLNSSKLKDGVNGFIITKNIPKVMSILSDDTRLTKGNLKIKIIDLGGSRGVAESLGEIIESLGGKVNLIEVGEQNNTDCTVLSNNQEARSFLSHTFGCNVGKLTDKTSFDVQITFGKTFSERF
jgi:hypothetical protein